MRPDAYEAALADLDEAQEVEGHGMVKTAFGFSPDAYHREGLAMSA
jgi:hypothetical protein